MEGIVTGFPELVNNYTILRAETLQCSTTGECGVVDRGMLFVDRALLCC